MDEAGQREAEGRDHRLREAAAGLEGRPGEVRRFAGAGFRPWVVTLHGAACVSTNKLWKIAGRRERRKNSSERKTLIREMRGRPARPEPDRKVDAVTQNPHSPCSPAPACAAWFPHHPRRAARHAGAPSAGGHEFDHQVTGVTVAEDGRIFVNFPRWTEDSAGSVAEVMPTARSGPIRTRSGTPGATRRRTRSIRGRHWVCVQSVVADGRGSLWVLDPAAPATGLWSPAARSWCRSTSPQPGDAAIAFDEDAAPQGTYLNDVRFTPDGGRLHHRFRRERRARRRRPGDRQGPARARRPSDPRSLKKGVVVKADGKVLRRPDGRGAEFAADGIALSATASTCTGRRSRATRCTASRPARWTMRRCTAKESKARSRESARSVPSDGLLIDRGDGCMSARSRTTRSRCERGRQVTTLLQDSRLRWPDTFAQGPDGTVYVTSSRIMDMQLVQAGKPAGVKNDIVPHRGHAAVGLATRGLQPLNHSGWA